MSNSHDKLDAADAWQIAFVSFKLCGVVDWSWWTVFLPYMVSFLINALVGVLKEAWKSAPDPDVATSGK